MKTTIRIMTIPILAAGAAWGQGEYDAVARGKEVYESMGCIVCHSTTKDDPSAKTGPNLHGLFLTEPREREVVIPANGEKKKVKADRAYFNDSIRKSWDALAISEKGATKGTAYGAIMPMFAPEVISDEDLEAMWHYVRTMADGYAAGPAQVMLQKKDAPPAASPLEIPNEEPVADRTRVFRVALPGTSGRTVAVGQPNGMSYAFDPRFLSVRKIWSGGFLNLKDERTARGGKAVALGNGAKTYFEDGPLLAPLTTGGEVVDFEFKESDVNDSDAQIKYLNDKADHIDRLAAQMIKPGDRGRLGTRIAQRAIDHHRVGLVAVVGKTRQLDLDVPRRAAVDGAPHDLPYLVAVVAGDDREGLDGSARPRQPLT
jgi:hypothetical protein